MLAGDRQIKRLGVLIARLQADKTVLKRDMRAVLTADEIAAHDDAWQNAKAFNDDFSETPQALKGYLKLLRRADAIQQRINSVTSSRAIALGGQADNAYEAVLEHLDELLSMDAGLADWFDRPVFYTAATAPGLEAEEMPRLINSRSFYKQGGGFTKRTIRDVKLMTLEEKLVALTTTQTPVNMTAANKRLKRRQARQDL